MDSSKVGTAWNADFSSLSRIFAPYAALAQEFSAHAAWPEIDTYNALARRSALTNAVGVPLTFVESAPKPSRRKRNAPPAPPYEQTIFERAEVPTRRHSWHDFFNMLVWNLVPRSKAALNERQCLVARGKTRTREQDRLAIFDEGGMIVAEPRGILPDGLESNGIATSPWSVVVGHAVHESVIMGNRDIRLMALVIVKEPGFFTRPLVEQIAEADTDVARFIGAGAFAPDAAPRADGAFFSHALLRDLG